MKKIAIAAGLAVLSTPVLASNPRAVALGGATNYVKDTDSLALNPAYVNDFNNFAIAEYRNGNAANDINGKYIVNRGSLIYGVALGSDSWDPTSFDANTIKEDNAVGLYIGGDMGVQWGARLKYSSAENKTAKDKTSALGLNVGFQQGMWEFYVNTDFGRSAEYENAGKMVEVKGKLGLLVGGAYTMGTTTFYGNYVMGGNERDAVTGSATKLAADESTLTLGVGHVHEVSKSAKILTDITFVTSKTENEIETASIAINDLKEKTETILPFNIAFEVDATDWLTLRGAVKQNVIIGGTKEIKYTANGATTTATTETYKANSTEVYSGATLNFGKLKIDGVLGLATNGKLSAQDVMTNVAVSYWF